MTIPAFAMIEVAVKQAIETGYPSAEGKVYGSLDPNKINETALTSSELLVAIALVPGGGSTDKTSGSWALDIDVFGVDYLGAMGHALAIEAMLVSGAHRTDTMIIDSVFENVAPAEGPWDDDSVFRISATYVFTARRI